MAQSVLSFAPQYSCVGSVLLNEINTLFSSTDQTYITTNLKKGDGTLIAVLRQSVYNNQSKLNVADVLKSLLSPNFDFNTNNFFFEDSTKYIEFYFDSLTANKRIAVYASKDEIEGTVLDFVCISEAQKGKFTSLMSELNCDMRGVFLSAYVQTALTHTYYLRKENSNNIDNFDIIDMKVNKNFLALVFFIPFIFGCESSEVSICRKIQYLDDYTFNKINGVSGWTQIDNFTESVAGESFDNANSLFTLIGDPSGFSVSKIARQFIPDTRISLGTYKVEILYNIVGANASNWTFYFNESSYTLNKNNNKVSFDITISSFSLGVYAFDWYVIQGSPSGFDLTDILNIEYISLTNDVFECISDIKKINYQNRQNEFSISFINHLGGVDCVSSNSPNKIYEKKESKKINEIVKDGFRKNSSIKKLSEKNIRLSITANQKDKKFLDSDLPASPYVCLRLGNAQHKECSIENTSLGDTNSYDNYYESEINIKINSDFFA